MGRDVISRQSLRLQPTGRLQFLQPAQVLMNYPPTLDRATSSILVLRCVRPPLDLLRRTFLSPVFAQQLSTQTISDGASALPL
ncbi:hypothetical protein HYQ46_004638 [Verticillium longisporum]|nr:hypothetical protein HYQ46_004638 [Verticillium longisporum]